jgi:hypothetical protein
LFAMILAACSSPRDEKAPAEPPRFDGVVELVAGEPVFRSEMDDLVARGVPEGVVLDHLRGYALLSSEARRSIRTVPAGALAMRRKRAAVQLYLRDLRATTEEPSEAVVRARHEESGDPRPFDEVADEIREAISMERTFARIVERVSATGDEVMPELTPEALPHVGDLRFRDGAP